MNQHEFYMNIALEEAKKAALQDEVPVGAIMVQNGEIIARAMNHKERKMNATAHAEMEAIAMASAHTNNWYLDEATLYVTLEPCAMCTGALINSRVKAVYFGAYDPKSGCCGSLHNFLADPRFNHNCPVVGGIMQEECASVLSQFFASKRAEKKANK
ncbi:MAG: tRNA adenosine(34) deaminase TadA [Bacillota bacterium]